MCQRLIDLPCTLSCSQEWNRRCTAIIVKTYRKVLACSNQHNTITVVTLYVTTAAVYMRQTHRLSANMPMCCLCTSPSSQNVRMHNEVTRATRGMHPRRHNRVIAPRTIALVASPNRLPLDAHWLYLGWRSLRGSHYSKSFERPCKRSGSFCWLPLPTSRL
jgi:hypothetical protein